MERLSRPLKMREVISRRIGSWARAGLVCLCILSLSVQFATADHVTVEQAETVAKGRLKAGDRLLGAAMPQNAGEVKAFKDDNGTTIFYVICLQPEGFVVVAADDWIEPIIAFSATGDYDPAPGNPLAVLLNKDLKKRVSVVRATQLQGGAKDAEASKAFEKWAALQVLESEDPPSLYGIPAVSDVRVAPLIQSRWSQSTEGGQPCYNYYTPNGYVCGCVATAMAQLMRFHQFPVQPLALGPYSITVNGVPGSRTLRGGDGVGGPYAWANMVLDPSAAMTDAQRQAIGALCHDAGVAAHMKYAPGGSGAYMDDATTALVNAFGYTNAIHGCDYDSGLTVATLRNMINTNLDGGLPSLLGIYGDGSGHAIVCDGYGIDSGTWYHHLNLGWAGTADAWYNLPIVDTSVGVTFNTVEDCCYNIRTVGSGEIISGRATHMNGTPIEGATITAVKAGGGSYQATTNGVGIYAIVGVPSGSSYTVSASKTGRIFTDQAVSTGTSINGSSTCGNRWAVDFIGSSGGVTLTQSGGTTAVAEGGAIDSYTAVLATLPTATVVITVSPNSQVTVNPTSLTFTPANWNVAQTVTVAAVNDTTLEWAHTGIITHSAASSDPAYNGIPISSVIVNITDDDSAGVMIAEITAGTGGGIWGAGIDNPEDPFNSYYHNSRAQTVILASELAGAGMGANASIAQLWLRCYEVHGRPTLAGFRIRMRHTTNTTSTAFVTSGWTGVFGPTDVVTTAGQWVSFTLGTPFTWNGTENLLLDLTRDDSVWESGGGMCVRTGLANRTFAGYSDDYSGLSWPFDTGLVAEQQHTIPEIRFSYMSSVGTLQFISATYSVNENGGSVTVSVSRAGGSFGAVGVNYATSNETALAGSDYNAASGTLSWANGDTSNKTFTVSIIDDTSYEGNETVKLALGGPSGGGTLGTPGAAVLTIVEDDPLPPAGNLQFTSATYSVNENGGSVTVSVSRAGGSFGAVGVNYSTSNGTASAGSDYTVASGTLSWANGDTGNKSFTVSILNDSTYDPNETVNLALSSPTGGATLGAPSTAVLTIQDDDPPPSTIGHSPFNFTFNATAGGSNPPGQSLSIWNSGGGTLNWSVSDNATWLSLIPTSGTSTVETDSVDLSVNTSGMLAGTYTATITISAPGAANTPQYSSVTLNLAPPPSISRSPATFTFNATAGGSNPLGQSLNIWNSGGGTLSWSGSDNASWLSLDPTSGASTGETDLVDLSVNTSGMIAGVYYAMITISASGAINSPQYCSVTLTVTSPFSVTPSMGLAASGEMGGPFAPASQVYTLQNSGDLPIDWTAAKNEEWVTLSSAGGTLLAGASTTVTVSINSVAELLPTGVYSDTVSFVNTTNGLGNTGRVVTLGVGNITWSRQMQTGWNAVSLAVQPPAGYSALDLYNDILADGGDPADIYRWFAGSWQALLVDVSGSPLELNSSDLVPGAGYMVCCSVASTWSLDGTPIPTPSQISFAWGWHFVSVPSWADDLYSSLAVHGQIVADGGNPREIYRWFAGSWQALLVEDAFGNPMELNPAKWRAGNAYMVYSQAPATWTVGD